jgi:small conductance mechanosensitive channel
MNIQLISEYAITYGLKIILAIVIVFIGRITAKWLKRVIKKLTTRGNVDKTLSNFLGDLIYILAMIIVIIIALNNLGVKTTSLIAVLGAATLALGLSLQSNLSNLGSGILLLFNRPFKVGDYVEAAGIGGTVNKVSLFQTEMVTPDNKKIFVPNSSITNSNIINYGAHDTRRLDLTVEIDYQDDVEKTREVLRNLAMSDSRVLKEPEPQIEVTELGANGIILIFRPWVKTADYWALKFSLLAGINKAFKENGITIPYPQRDVHVKQQMKGDE